MTEKANGTANAQGDGMASSAKDAHKGAKTGVPQVDASSTKKSRQPWHRRLSASKTTTTRGGVTEESPEAKKKRRWWPRNRQSNRTRKYTTARKCPDCAPDDASTEADQTEFSDEIEDYEAIEVVKHEQGSIFVMPKRQPNRTGVVSSEKRQTPSYEDTCWSDLPGEAQEAAELLGYTKDLWDSDEDLPIWDKDYGDLTAEERSATLALGYTEANWAKQDRKGPENHYDDYNWSELPVQVQRAASDLGYNKKLWDGDEEVSTLNKYYSKLTAKERSAARVLGYTAEEWTIQRTRSADLHYKDSDWLKLPAPVKRAARILGYNRKLWDSGKHSSISNKDYCELTSVEESAAMVLGYDSAEKWEAAWQDDTPKENVRHEDEDRDESDFAFAEALAEGFDALGIQIDSVEALRSFVQDDSRDNSGISSPTLHEGNETVNLGRRMISFC